VVAYEAVYEERERLDAQAIAGQDKRRNEEIAVEWTGLREGEVTVAGVRSPYLEVGPSGAAEAAVFVLGNPGSSRDWVDLLSRIGQFGRAVAPDISGFGDTGEECAHLLGGFLEEIGVQRAHLVLHGSGGRCGLFWACERPVAFASVTLISAGVVIDDDFDEGFRRATDVMKISRNQAEVLRSPNRPALTLWGARDPYLPVRYAERQREVFPRARIVVLDESGPLPPSYDPEAVADEVVLFLRRNLTGGRQPGLERRVASETQETKR
jgi:pimeloyl-ACP methyl ester carboxylesterase